MAAEAESQPHIVKAIGTAYMWRDRLIDGQFTVAELGVQEGREPTQIHKILRLTYLGPTILKLALTGGLPLSVTLKRLNEAGKLINWEEQTTHLGLSQPMVRCQR